MVNFKSINTRWATSHPFNDWQITHCSFFISLPLNPRLVVKWGSESIYLGGFSLKIVGNGQLLNKKFVSLFSDGLQKVGETLLRLTLPLQVAICSVLSTWSCKPAIKCCERQAVLSNGEGNTQGASPQVGTDFELWTQPFQLSRSSEFPHTKICNQAFFLKWLKASKAQSWRSLMPKQSFPSHPQLCMQKMIN